MISSSISPFKQQVRSANQSALPTRPLAAPASARTVRFSGDGYEDSFELYIDSPDLPVSASNHEALALIQQVLKGLEPVLEALNEIVIANKFPLERKIIGPPEYTEQKLGDYIKRQPQFVALLSQNPQGLKQGLEQLVNLSKTLEQLPASRELKGRNSYAHKHFTNHILNDALQKLLDDPRQMESVTQRLTKAMIVANQNASWDPELKVEERVLRAIELHDYKVHLLEETLKALEQRHFVEYLNPHAFEPDPSAPAVVRDTLKHLQTIAEEPSPELRQEAVDALALKEKGMSDFLQFQKHQLKSSHAIYTSLSELLRGKVMQAFAEPFPSLPTHKLKNMPGFRSLWESCGGDPNLLNTLPWDFNPNPPFDGVYTENWR